MANEPQFASKKAREAIELLADPEKLEGRQLSGMISRAGTGFYDAQNSLMKRWLTKVKKFKVEHFDVRSYKIPRESSILKIDDGIKALKEWVKKPSYRGKPLNDGFDGEWSEKAIKSAAEFAKDMIALYVSWKPVAKLVVDAEAFKVTRKKRSEYQPPPQAMKALKRIQVMLNSMIMDESKRLEAETLKYYEQLIKNYVEYRAKMKAEGKPAYHPHRYFNGGDAPRTVNMALDPRNNYERKPDADANLKKEAKRYVEMIAESFVSKNMAKLTRVISEREKQGKTALTDIDPGRTKASGMGFTGEMSFTFADDTAFTVRNNIVFKRSINGVSFVQFPTTFHQVKWPGGKTSAKESEKDMNQKWVSAGTENDGVVELLNATGHTELGRQLAEL